MLIAVTDFPDPDSPTTARTSPGATLEVDAPDRLDRTVVGREVDREVARLEQGGPGGHVVLHVERVTEAVAHQQEPQHRER